MAIEDLRDGDRVLWLLWMVEGTVEPSSEVVDILEGKSEDEVEQVAHRVLVVGVAPEEQPAPVQATPCFLLREDLELAMRGVNPAVALQQPHLAVTPRIFTLFIWVYAYEPPVVANLARVVPGLSIPPARKNRVNLISMCNDINSVFHVQRYHNDVHVWRCEPYLPLHAFKLKSSSVHLLSSGRRCS